MNKQIKYSYITEKMTPHQRELSRQYKKEQDKKNNYPGGGFRYTNSRKKIETLDNMHRYLRKLAEKRDSESDKKIKLAHKSLSNIFKVPKDSNIQFHTYRDYTGKRYPDEEDFVKDEDGYRYGVSTYPHHQKDSDGKSIILPGNTLYHGTSKNIDTPRASQFSFGHSGGNGYDTHTRLHPGRRIYGFNNPDDKDLSYYCGGDKSNVKSVDTKGKPIYKNSESDEGGFIEFESCYEEIYNTLCYFVENELLSIEDAEIINERAYEKYNN